MTELVALLNDESVGYVAADVLTSKSNRIVELVGFVGSSQITTKAPPKLRYSPSIELLYRVLT